MAMIGVRRQNSKPLSARRELSLVTALDMRAEREGESVAFVFLPDGETEGSSLTYSELQSRTRVLGSRLLEAGLAGQTVLLLHPPGLDFVIALFACLRIGAIPVPAFPPEQTREKRLLPRLEAIARDARPAAALSTEDTITGVLRHGADIPSLAGVEWIATDLSQYSGGDSDVFPSVDPTAVAYLQYTSGSTALPRGVVVTHQNVIENCRVTSERLGLDGAGLFVSWLPTFHDMGLIGGVLRPLLGGFPSILMPPAAFLEKPIRWLRAISEHGATSSAAPNFAFDLCVRRTSPEDRKSLDLTRWQTVSNGAEPVRADTIDRFTEAFGAYGFRREVFCPGFGLAEATLTVSLSGLNEQPVVENVDPDAFKRGEVAPPVDGTSGRVIVGSGRPLNDCVTIVNPVSRAVCSDCSIGEVWVSGPSVGAGYWGRFEQTTETFEARLDSGRGPYLRTGDLGFMSNGELFITGRLKDLIIVHGFNHYPQDVEQSLERSHPSIRRGCSAAFAIDQGGGEKLGIAFEVDESADAVLDEIVASARAAVARDHGLSASLIAVLPPRTIPKTSSGKIQRSTCRQSVLDGSLVTRLLWRE
jgi:acyl-CoA synthetase (AMP-forming)/AMP-acid ligase II